MFLILCPVVFVENNANYSTSWAPRGYTIQATCIPLQCTGTCTRAAALWCIPCTSLVFAIAIAAVDAVMGVYKCKD